MKRNLLKMNGRNRAVNIITFFIIVFVGCYSDDTYSKSIAGDERIIRVNISNKVSPGPEYYGTNGWWTDQDADLFRSRYEELGAKVVRLPIIQGILEPSNDNNDPHGIEWSNFYFDRPYPFFDKTVTYQKWFKCLKDLNIKIMIYFPYISGWLSENGDRDLVSTYPPNNYDEYGEFLFVVLQYLVGTLNYPAQDIILEPINEPDLRCGQDKLVSCFWENWQEDDIGKIFEAAFDARNRVSKEISIIGLSECCSVNLIKAFLDDPNNEQYLDGLSYHRYVTYPFENAIDRGNMLKKYKKPVFINEYGNRRFWSNGIEGAIWHSYALSLLWENNINPIQFPISEFRGNGHDYRELGLFKDWTEKWEIKPAFWVYRNYYKYMANSTILGVETELSLKVSAVKPNDVDNQIIIWVTNLTEKSCNDSRFIIENFFVENAKVVVYNNLIAKSHIETFAIHNSNQFIYDIPGKSSFCFRIIDKN